MFAADVWAAAAAAGGGPAEEGGGHQEDQRQPGCRGHQGQALHSTLTDHHNRKGVYGFLYCRFCQ